MLLTHSGANYYLDPNRLKMIRHQFNLDKLEMIHRFNDRFAADTPPLSLPVLRQLESGALIPGQPLWHRLAEFYQVDEHWLRQSPAQELTHLTQRFADRLFLLRSDAAVSPLQVATMTGIDFHRLEALERGNELPTTIEVVALATYFKVTTDVLLLSDQEPAPRHRVSQTAD